MPPLVCIRGSRGWMGACHLGSAFAAIHFVFHLADKVCSLDLLSFRCVLLQLSAMDVLARTPMKGAAKCDEHCELQNSVNQ